jgi:hypothetical protein
MLLFGSWQPQGALRLLCGLSYVEPKHEHESDPMLDGSPTDYAAYTRLLGFWHHELIDHDAPQKPQFFIEWALSKKHFIPWLDWHRGAKIKPISTANQNDNDWKVQARAIADECFDKDTKNSCRDSLKGYSKRVMGLMQERGIKGARGIIDNQSTIMREALQGAKWWSNKSK